jgi:hypothetical protein
MRGGPSGGKSSDLHSKKIWHGKEDFTILKVARRSPNVAGKHGAVWWISPQSLR